MRSGERLVADGKCAKLSFSVRYRLSATLHPEQLLKRRLNQMELLITLTMTVHLC